MLSFCSSAVGKERSRLINKNNLDRNVNNKGIKVDTNIIIIVELLLIRVKIYKL